VKQRHLGRSGLVVSRLGLGTMTWGRDTDEDDAAAQLIAFREAGGTLVDTADVYAGGESERVLGRLLADVVPRDEVVLATKAYGVTGPGPMGRGTSRGHLLTALDASLRRLGTDHVDLWQLHAWDPVTPWEESLAAVDTAVQSGRVRYVGVSNFCGWQLAAPRPGSAAGRAARRSSATRWSTPCCSAASSARWCRPPPSWASGCCPGRRWAAAC
jgi:aryl-alcohol dehydrogenase-like predicted oxidoreductase